MSAPHDRSSPESGWNHRFAAVNGVDMHHVREGQGRPLILRHGWPEFWWGWSRNIPVLAHDFDVIAPDFRGFGDTRETASTPAGPDTHARDILALADELGLARFGVVAHDVGASVAQQLARLAPERLTGLFIFNAPYPGIGRRWVDAEHVKEIWYQSFNQQPHAPALVGHSRDTCRIYLEGMLRHWSHSPTVFDSEIAHFVDNFMKPGNLEGGFAWYHATHAARMALVRDGAPQLPRIETPSRFFWGRHDPVIPCSWMDRLPDYFANPELEIAEEAGHFVHWETPKAANERILAFFGNMR